MPCGHSYLQVNFYKRFDGAVSITVVLKESGFEPKVEGSSPSKTYFFFFFFFLLSQRAGIIRDLHVCRKKACSDVLCTCRATSLSKMARLVKKRNLE